VYVQKTCNVADAECGGEGLAASAGEAAAAAGEEAAAAAEEDALDEVAADIFDDFGFDVMTTAADNKKRRVEQRAISCGAEKIARGTSECAGRFARAHAAHVVPRPPLLSSTPTCVCAVCGVTQRRCSCNVCARRGAMRRLAEAAQLSVPWRFRTDDEKKDEDNGRAYDGDWTKSIDTVITMFTGEFCTYQLNLMEFSLLLLLFEVRKTLASKLSQYTSIDADDINGQHSMLCTLCTSSAHRCRFFYTVHARQASPFMRVHSSLLVVLTQIQPAALGLQATSDSPSDRVCDWPSHAYCTIASHSTVHSAAVHSQSAELQI
jgi:hypothetical protein